MRTGNGLNPAKAWKRRKPLEKEATSGQKLVTSGGWALGMGTATLFGGLVALFSAGLPGAFLLTAGVALMLSGLIVLIVGAARRSEEKAEGR